MENVDTKILEIFVKKRDYDEEYNNLMFSFVTKAYELVELSENLYQLERTIELNQISLKDYILNSEICIFLKKKNINNYSIADLKLIMLKYENQNISNITSYKLALELYEKLEELKNIESKKIDYELKQISNILKGISNIENISKDKYYDLYSQLLRQIKVEYLDKELIDDKINNYIIEILSDIFNYYLYGNKEIPVDMWCRDDFKFFSKISLIY